MSDRRHTDPRRGPDKDDVESAAVARMDLRLSDEEKAALQREADRQGLDLSAVARQAFAFYLGWLERQRKPDD